MAEFADILADVEAAPQVTSTRAAMSFYYHLFVSIESADLNDDGARLRSVADAYQETVVLNRHPPIAQNDRAFSPNAQLSPPEIIHHFSQELIQARQASEKLRALRRKMAWALHPDRAANEQSDSSKLMAFVNATIDAALSECAKL